MRSEAFENALRHLEAAPFDSASWVSALRATRDATGSAVGQFFVWDGQGEVIGNCYSESIDDAEWLAAGGGDADRNPYMRAATTLRAGQGFAEWEIVAPEDRRRHPIIGDIHDRYDIPHLCTFKLLETRKTKVFFVTLRSSKQGPICREERSTFHRICRSASVSARRAAAIADEGAKLLAGAFTSIAKPVFVCDAFGYVMAFSESAELLVRSGNVLSLCAGVLRARTTRSAAALNRAIFSAARHMPGSEPDASGRIPLRDGEGRIAAVAEALPLPRDRRGIAFGATSLVVVDELPISHPPRLAEAHSLTKSEREVLRLLLRGNRLADVARTRSVSVETIRSQAKSIYSKLNVAGQLELVARFGKRI